MLFNEAGKAQVAAGTTRSAWGVPGGRFTGRGGIGTFGDDPRDAYWISQGINAAKRHPISPQSLATP